MKKLLIILVILPLFTQAQQIIVTISGDGTMGYSGDNGPAVNAKLSAPDMMALDKDGNIYFGDLDNSRIRKITIATGIITTFAGNGTRGYSGDGGPATNAELNDPDCFAFDSSGNLYFGDAWNHRVRRIDHATGIISTIAGTGVHGFSGDGGPATNAELFEIFGICFDRHYNLYLADYNNKRIRKIDRATGIITTFAGNGSTGYSGDGSPAINAQIDAADVFADSMNNIYIADEWNHAVRKVDAVTGIITTVAGNGTSGYSGDGGPASNAQLSVARGLFIDKQQNIYITEELGGNVRRIDAITGTITTVAGHGVSGYAGDGGPATNAELACTSVALNHDGVMYIVDGHNHCIRKVFDPALVSCANLAKTASYTISPNPATKNITIASSTLINNVIITDALGRKVFSGSFNEEKIEIDISIFQMGIYFININNLEQQKFVKQ